MSICVASKMDLHQCLKQSTLYRDTFVWPEASWWAPLARVTTGIYNSSLEASSAARNVACP